MIQNKSDIGSHLNNISEPIQSEMHHKFQSPIIKKPAVTRSKRLEQFLWHEFYNEYIRSKERLHTMPSENPTTEYLDEFGKLAPHLKKKGMEIEIAGEILTNKFPLYSNAAITLWNPNGELACNFGKTLSITLPISEQRGQFE